jgi:hypothetical protein
MLRKQGYECGVVERYNSFTHTRNDLFGFIDLIAIGEGRILAVQATGGDGGNHAARRSKALAEPRLKTWLESGGQFAVVSWAKRGARGERKLWTARVEYVTRGDLENSELTGPARAEVLERLGIKVGA